jgi:hypothetical protein
MARVFDPYARWLGIAPEDQPPNHYRLLAIDRDEQDAQAIRQAADRRMDLLNTFETDDRPELIDRLLGEVTRAHDTLSDPHARAKYDRGLAAEARLAEKLAASESGEGVTAAVGHLIQGDGELATTSESAGDASSPGDGFMGIDTSDASSARTRRAGGRSSGGRSSTGRSSAGRGASSRNTGSRSSMARRGGRDSDDDESGRGSGKGDQTTRNVAIIAGIGGGVLLLCIVMFAVFGGGDSGEKKKKPQAQVTKTKKKQRGGFTGTSAAARRRAKMDAPTKGAALSSLAEIADMMSVLQSGNADEKIRSCGELGDLGFHARGARRALIDVARNDPNPQVQQAATVAIGKIENALRKKKARFLDPFTSPPPPVEEAGPDKTKPPVKETPKPKPGPPAEKPPKLKTTPPTKKQPSKPLPVPDFDSSAKPAPIK